MRQKIHINSNIYFITEDHPFTEILKLSDGFIRATTTDGDALSIREAIKLNIPVIASTSVDRPKECILFELDSIADLENILNTIDTYSIDVSDNNKKSVVEEIIKIYKDLY